MSQHTKIAGITVGQSPRTDMTCDLIPKLALNLELVEYGALDGLTLADIERDLAPEQIDELIKYVDLQMADSTASWHMQADGTYVRHCKDEEGRPLVDSQEYLIKKHTRRPVRH